MMTYPKPGEICVVWFKAGAAIPRHGRLGVVVIVGETRPRHHGVVIDGHLQLIPSGNLRRTTPTAEDLWNAHQDLCKYREKSRTDRAMPEVAGLQDLIDRLYREHHQAQRKGHP